MSRTSQGFFSQSDFRSREETELRKRYNLMAEAGTSKTKKKRGSRKSHKQFMAQSAINPMIKERVSCWSSYE